MERVRELAPFVKEALQKAAVVAKVFCFFHATNKYLCSVNFLIGPSMLPTIDHNFALAESISTRRGKVGSGDIVMIRSPEAPKKVVLKRIKAVESDVVSYVDPDSSDEPKTVVVPRGMFGWKEIICRAVGIQGSLVQFLMHIYKAEFSFWCGLVRITD